MRRHQINQVVDSLDRLKGYPYKISHAATRMRPVLVKLSDEVAKYQKDLYTAEENAYVDKVQALGMKHAAENADGSKKVSPDGKYYVLKDKAAHATELEALKEEHKDIVESLKRKDAAITEYLNEVVTVDRWKLPVDLLGEWGSGDDKGKPPSEEVTLLSYVIEFE